MDKYSVSSWCFHVAAMTSFPTKAPAAAYIPYVQTSPTCTPTDILRLCCSWSSWKLPPFPGFPVATEKSPSLYFLIRQGPCHSHLFHVLGQAGPGFNARLISRVVQMAGIQPVLLPDVRHMPWTRSWNYFYFLLLFSINFQWIRFPDLVCSIALQRAGTGKIEEWCSMAWGQIRWYWM